jgi:phosphoglycolate phosphatase
MLTRLTAHFHNHLPQLIIFDLDGTLVDSVPDLASAVDRMLEQLGHPAAGEAKVRGWVGNGAALLVRRALADSADPGIVAAVDDERHAQALTLFKQIYQQENGRLTRLYPGVRDVLSGLAGLGIPLAMVTNKPLPFTTPLLEQFAIAPYFRSVIGGECLPERKPHPLPLLHVCEQLGVQPRASLMVGDSRNDIDAAKAAGMISAALTYGYNHGEPVAACDPDWLLDDFRELLI